MVSGCFEQEVRRHLRAPKIAERSTYYAAKERENNPSARAVRDPAMMQVLMTLWVANRKVYGTHRIWKAAQRAGPTSAATRQRG